ncbi:metal-dependent hydrolase [Flavobacteriaceae bacterium F08102]|nr:metal-dependent hydrolase [Flavobacteriaceae bacterium F08102]
MKIQYLGHASLAITTGGKTVLVDPFISANELASSIDVDSLAADYILITHAHQDHILDVERIAKRTGATLVSNFEIIEHFTKKGCKGHPMNHGGSWQFDFGTLNYVNAVHSSSFPDGSYGGQPGGFVLTTNEGCVYISGDTALTYDMKLLPLFHAIDLAILPIGDNFTMGIDAAVMAAQFVKCTRVLGVHYDTFGYIKIDHEQAKNAFAKQGIDLTLLDIGQDLSL